MSCLDQLFSGSIALIMAPFNEVLKYSWRLHSKFVKTDFGGERFNFKETFCNWKYDPFYVFAGSSVPA